MHVLASLISDNQSAYVDGRFIRQGGRLIANVLQTPDALKLSGTLVTIDIKKAFNSVNHKFLTLALKRCGFAKMFIKRRKTLLNNQESCIINGGFTTKGITKPCTQLHPAPSNSTQLHPAPSTSTQLISTSTQLQTPPSSSFQPPPSSLQSIPSTIFEPKYCT